MEYEALRGRLDLLVARAAPFRELQDRAIELRRSLTKSDRTALPFVEADTVALERELAQQPPPEAPPTPAVAPQPPPPVRLQPQPAVGAPLRPVAPPPPLSERDQLLLLQRQLVRAIEAKIVPYIDAQPALTAARAAVRALDLPHLEEQKTALLASIDEATLHALEAMQDGKRTLKRRLFEIFTGVTPYPDLVPLCRKIREELCVLVERADEAFLEGRSDGEGYRRLCAACSYEHDVMRLRRDLRFRATRLRELRATCHELLARMQRMERLQAVVGMRDEAIHGLITTLRGQLRELESPFGIFAAAASPEEVNEVFLRRWVAMERLQGTVQGIEQRSEQLLAGKPLLAERLHKAVDGLEEVVRAAEGHRPTLVAWAVGLPYRQVEQELERRYPWVRPWSYWLTLPYRERQERLRQAYDLWQRTESTRRFAKLMQQIKVFEEEYVDDILEAFECVGVIEEWGPYVHSLEHAMRLVEEQVLLDVGLLDMHALLDIDEERLRGMLREAVHKAQSQVPDAPPIDGEGNSAFWLRQLRVLSHRLFDRKVEEGVKAGNASACYAAIVSGARRLAATAMGNLALQRAVEALDLAEEVPAAYKQAWEAVQRALPPSDARQALGERVAALSQLPPEAKTRACIHYLPGVLEFFAT